MAIKGKRKSQRRGSQARRRPASAPRPVISGGRRAAWYKTPGGRIGLALVVALIAALGLVLWNNSKNDTKALEARQEALDGYTGELRSLLQTITPPATAMQAVPPTGGGKAIRELPETSTRWFKLIDRAQNRAFSIAPPDELRTQSQVFTESVTLYRSAASLYRDAAALEGKAQKDVLARAAEVRDRASSLWSIGTSMLDEARRDAELDPSGLRPPSVAG